VLDAVYGPQETPLVRDARNAGLAVIDGFELLVAQAVLQYRLLTGAEALADTMAEAGLAWLSERRRPDAHDA
jgi:shikimate 5-dehydrogenase